MACNEKEKGAGKTDVKEAGGKEKEERESRVSGKNIKSPDKSHDPSDILT